MTNEQLNQLFESAKSVPTVTSSEEIASWVGIAAASSTGVLGTMGKLKLLIAKKSMLMLASTFTFITAGIITVVSFSSNSEPEKETSPSVVAAQKVERDSSKEKMEVAPKFNRTEVSTEINTETKVVSVLEEVNPTEKMLPFLEPKKIQRPIVKIDPSPNIVFVEKTAIIGKKDFDVSEFNKLEISGICDVILRQGNKNEVKLEGPEESLKLFEIKNNGQTLVVSAEGKMEKAKHPVIYITFTDLKEFSYSGVGNVTTEGPIDIDKLSCKINGVGDVSLDLNCTDLSIYFTGVGDLHLSGSGDEAKYQWAGVGDLKAKNMKYKNTDINMSGVGDASVYASERLDIKLTGIGDVKYAGSPKNKTVNKSGRGKVSGS